MNTKFRKNLSKYRGDVGDTKQKRVDNPCIRRHVIKLRLWKRHIIGQDNMVINPIFWICF